MTVSIITATYNSSQEIRTTYESICNQTYTDWVWLVTDDCSKDNTWEILKKISACDARVYIQANKCNSGAAVSRNRSLRLANSCYIAFIDSDDIWLPTKLEEQVEFMEKGNLDFSFSAYEIVDGYGKKTGKVVDLDNASHFDYEDMLRKKATLGCSTVMLRKDAFSDISMPLLRTGQDYATWLKLLKSGKNAYLLNKILTQYRILPNSISRNKFRKALRQWDIYRKVEGINFYKSSLCFTYYAWRAIFRK